MKTTIRKLSKEDILMLLQKVDLYFVPTPLSRKVNLISYAEKLAEIATHFVVEENDKIIGMTCCYLNDPKKVKAFISVTCIDPDYFGIGLGQKLTNTCEIHAKDLGFSIIEFEVHINNMPSIDMHKKIGYNIDRRAGMSYFMIKKLIN